MKINNFFSSLICNWKNMRARYPVVMDSGLSDSGLYGVSPIPIPPFVVKIKKDHICKVVGTFNDCKHKLHCLWHSLLYNNGVPTCRSGQLIDRCLQGVETLSANKCLLFIII